MAREYHLKLAASLDLAGLREAGDCFAIDGHAAQEGEGRVFAVHRETSRRFVADSAIFEYLTIHLPEATAGDRIEIPAGGTAFYSYGSLAFPSRSGCIGYASRGYVQIDEVRSSTIRASLELEIQAISPRGIKKDCGAINIREKLRFRRISRWVNPSCIGSRD